MIDREERRVAGRLHEQLAYPADDPRRIETLLAFAECEAKLDRVSSACDLLRAHLPSPDGAKALDSERRDEWQRRCGVIGPSAP